MERKTKRGKIFLRACALAIVILYVHLSGCKAPPPASISRVGILIPESQRSESQVIRGLRDGLGELGYRERKDILIEIRNAKGDRGALKPMASDLVSRQVKAIVTTGTRATQVAKEATTEIPIVLVHPADPVALGLVKSMARPGENVTGVAAFALEATGKRLEALREVLPKTRRVRIFYDANNPFSKENFAAAQSAAVKLGLEVAAHPVKSVSELKSSLSRLEKDDADALFHVPDDLVESQTEFLFDVARRKGLPTMFNEEIWAINGALAAYGPSYYQMGRQAAMLVDKILKGKKPQELPVERATQFELAINFRVANAMGLTIPAETLKKADRVIR